VKARLTRLAYSVAALAALAAALGAGRNWHLTGRPRHTRSGRRPRCLRARPMHGSYRRHRTAGFADLRR
jgi:hypothetical protein